jgi:TPR repeat protein
VDPEAGPLVDYYVQAIEMTSYGITDTRIPEAFLKGDAKLGVQQSPQQAWDLYMKLAAGSRLPEAQRFVIQAYEMGFEGIVKPDPSKVLEWRTIRANAGDAESMVEVGLVHFRDTVNPDQNMVLAKQYFADALKSPNVPGSSLAKVGDAFMEKHDGIIRQSTKPDLDPAAARKLEITSRIYMNDALNFYGSAIKKGDASAAKKLLSMLGKSKRDDPVIASMLLAVRSDESNPVVSMIDASFTATHMISDENPAE